MLSSALLLAACGIAPALANPIAASEPQVNEASAVDKRATCTFSGASGAASVASGKKSCSSIVLSSLVVPAGTTLDLTGLNAGTHVTFEGTTTFGYKEWAGPLVAVSGTNIIVTGASGSILDGGGARWWDGKGSNGGKTKPKFFQAHSLTTSSISYLTIKNSPVQVFSIDNANGLTLDHITVNDAAGDTQGAHNTDAFDVGDSQGVIISNANVQNQDDCLAINSGTNITFTGGTCSGGHGLSIGSVGGRSDNTVKDVHIENSSITKSANGVRIKTVYGATGSVSGVTYQDITLSGITSYGVVIEQDYENGSPTGTPTGGVPITGLTLDNVHGTVTSSATDIYILCASGACSGWTWEGVNVTGGKKGACKNVPAGASC